MSLNQPKLTAVPNAARIAEHLLAHAHLCRHIAERTWSEETARQFDTLAGECVRAAATLMPDAALEGPTLARYRSVPPATTADQWNS